MKMQGQKGKCKADIKSYSLDRFEQVERSKTPDRALSNFILIWIRKGKLLEGAYLVKHSLLTLGGHLPLIIYLDKKNVV